MKARFFGAWYDATTTGWCCTPGVSVLNTQIRRAHVPHKCDTCSRKIQVGQTYRRMVTIGGPQKFKTVRTHWGVGTRCWELYREPWHG